MSEEEKKPLLDGGNTSKRSRKTESKDENGQPKVFMRQTRWKWLLFVCGSMITMGAYFCYDNPASIETTLETDFGISQFQFSFLYAAYSLPTTVFPLFGGIFLDKIGVKLGILLFCGCELFGQCLVCLGGFVHSFRTMVSGRVFLGIGAENIFVASHFLLCKWFSGNMFSLVLNTSMSFGFFGWSLNGIILPAIYNTDSMDMLGWALFIGVVFSAFSMCMGLIGAFLDEKADEQEGKFEEGEGGHGEEGFHFRDMKELNYAFWLTIFAQMFIFCGMFAAIQVSTKIMESVWKIDANIAERCYAIPYYLLVLTGPLTGWYIVRFGHKLYLLLFASFMQVVGHLLNMLLPECEDTCMYGILPSVCIGISFAIIYPTMLGIIPVVVEEKVLGTAFGIATCSYNYPDFMSPLIGSAIHDNTLNIKEGYYWQSFYWVVTSSIGFILLVCLQIENIRNYNNRMNQNQASFRQYDDEQKKLKKERSYHTFGDHSLELTYEGK